MNTSHSRKQFQFTLLFAIGLVLVPNELQLCLGQTRKPLTRSAIVVDERLAALRVAPDLSASLLKRLSKGRRVVLLRSQRSAEGTVFHRVAVTRRTRGWIQREALVFPQRSGEDAKLLGLIRVSRDFDRIVRARIFLEAFPHSSLRPAVLLILAEAASDAALKLSHDAARRLDLEETTAAGALLLPTFSTTADSIAIDVRELCSLSTKSRVSFITTVRPGRNCCGAMVAATKPLLRASDYDPVRKNSVRDNLRFAKSGLRLYCCGPFLQPPDECDANSGSQKTPGVNPSASRRKFRRNQQHGC